MSETVILPEFEKPPLIEVVHGVQFRPLNLSIVHPGLFYQQIAQWYPRVETREALGQVREIFGPAAMVPTPRIQLMSPADLLPRAWFVSSDAARLVQMQRDRLLFNWRAVENGAAYPRYTGMLSEFNRIYLAFQEFLEKNSLGLMEPDQVEMTYISHFMSDDDRTESPNPSSILRVWNDNVGEEWQNLPEDLNFGMRYLIFGKDHTPVGRLYATFSTGARPNGQRLLQFELTARGAPVSPAWEGVAGFLDIAHSHIVRCFAGITTPAAHAAWRRR